MDVAIKIQFPGIVQSITSDLGYLKLLLGASALLPKGLFLDSTIKVRSGLIRHHFLGLMCMNDKGIQRGARG